MDQNSLILVMTVFVALAAIAMIAQAISLVGMLLAVQKIRAKVFSVWPDVESIIKTSKQTIESATRQVDKITSASVAVAELTRQRALKVDDLLGDATTRAKVQMERAEMVLDDTMTRVQQTVSIVQGGVIRPIREVQGIVSGIRTAITYLGRSTRSTVDHATSDEEMFI